MLSDQRVHKIELWVAGAGFANRCERAGEGWKFTPVCARDSAPEGTDLWKSTHGDDDPGWLREVDRRLR
eukprot:1490227-Prymnesium_polylepis.1